MHHPTPGSRAQQPFRARDEIAPAPPNTASTIQHTGSISLTAGARPSSDLRCHSTRFSRIRNLGSSKRRLPGSVTSWGQAQQHEGNRGGGGGATDPRTPATRTVSYKLTGNTHQANDQRGNPRSRQNHRKYTSHGKSLKGKLGRTSRPNRPGLSLRGGEN
jgi:hypothetical protein